MANVKAAIKQVDLEKLFLKCTLGKERGIVTARTVAQFFSTPFNIWADAYAPQDKKDPESAHLKLLFTRGREHEIKVVKKLFKGITEIVYRKDAEGLKLVLESMARGDKFIHDCPLMFLEDGLYGRADILEKKRGKSIFGDYYYIVKEVKMAKNIREDHLLQAAFYNYVIGKIQGYTPEKFYIINGEMETIESDYSSIQGRLREAIRGSIEIIETGKQPPSYYNGADDPWESYCNEIAIKNNDVSLIYGLGATAREKLNKIGIFTVKNFLNPPKNKMSVLKKLCNSRYERWVHQANALMENKVILIEKPNFPKVSTEIYFDIEGDPDMGIDYLYGCLVVKNGKEKFHHYWANGAHEEKKMWKEFCAYIKSLAHGDFAIYYYSPYEVRSINRMAKLYGCDEKLMQKLKDHMVDLFPMVVRSFAFPIYSYSVKPIAKFIGFKWRASDAGGGNSMEWYSQFLQGNKSIKQKILDYNEDDVKATYVLKEWMEKYYL